MRRWSCRELGDIQLVLERAEIGSVGERWEEDAQDDDETVDKNGVEAGQAPLATAALGGGTVDLDLDTGPFVVTAAVFFLLFAVGFACYK